MDGWDKPGHDAEEVAVLTNRKWLAVLAAMLFAAIVFATLAPKGWPVRLGLHWLVEHFLVYFALTTLFCLAWPRPMLVAMLLLPVAVGLEAAQGLTPDRTPDAATALAAATGVACGALLADGLLAWQKSRRKG